MRTIILGTAHLSTTPGKRSVDGRLKEYAYSREIVRRVSGQLMAQGYNVAVDYMPENPCEQMNGTTWRQEQSRELKYRVNSVNNLCKKYGTSNCVYVSIHINAAKSDGKWHDASGFSVFVANNASADSKQLARIFTTTAIDMNLTGNRSIPSVRFWQANLYVLRNTWCAAVLTENLFQDNRNDVDFLLSEEGKQTITNLHVKSILEYIENKSGIHIKDALRKL